MFYFTTCGWMMWNWLVSGLASGAVLLLYDGSPFVAGADGKNGSILFDYADAEGMTHFGTSAKFIDAVAKAELSPIRSHKLSSVRAMFSTGSPLAPEGFDYVPEIKGDMLLASISGGTDILSCFVLGNPVLPVYRGEIQCRGLGMAVEVFDDEGRPVRGEKGELVYKPFPSHAGRILERQRRQQVPRCLFRALRQSLVPRRFCRTHGARRHDHLRSFGCHAQPRGRAYRYRRDLPPGRETAGSRRVARDRAGLATRCHRRRSRSPVRQSCARARRWMRRLSIA